MRRSHPENPAYIHILYKLFDNSSLYETLLLGTACIQITDLKLYRY